jgi:hypothetical protein
MRTPFFYGVLLGGGVSVMVELMAGRLVTDGQRVRVGVGVRVGVSVLVGVELGVGELVAVFSTPLSSGPRCNSWAVWSKNSNNSPTCSMEK